MGKKIQIFSESELSEEVLSQIREQEFVGKKRAKISKKRVITGTILSLLFCIVIAFSVLAVSAVYEKNTLYKMMQVEAADIKQDRLYIEPTELNIYKDYEKDLSGKASGNYMVRDDEYFYVVNLVGDNCIYRISKDRSEKKKMSDVPAQKLILSDGVLFFSNPYDSSVYPCGIYKIYLDGLTEDESPENNMICSAYVEDMVLLNGQLFYVDGHNKNLYSKNILTCDEQLIASGAFSNIVLCDDVLYFAKEAEASAEYQICKLTGENRVIQLAAANSKFYDVNNGYLYAAKEDSVGIYRLTADGVSDTEENVPLKNIRNIRVNDNKLYAVDESASGELCIYDLKDKSEVSLNVSHVVDFEIAGNCLITQYVEEYQVCVTINDIDTFKENTIFEVLK